MASPTLLLDDIKIASPCRASWEGMRGNDRVRYCGQCEKNVYNLSGMTRDAAQELVLRSEGRLCVRFYRRADGTVLTQDCPAGIAALKRRAYMLGGLAAGLAAAFLFATIGAVTAGAFVLPRLNGPRNAPGPIQWVMDFIFPPRPVVMGGICPVGVDVIPDPPAPVPPDVNGDIQP